MGVWLLFLSSTFNIWSLATVSTPQICSSKILWLPLAMAKTSAIASTHGSSRPGSERHHCVWTTASRSWSRSHGRLKTMMRCNLRSTPSFIMMRLSVIQKSCVLVAGFSYNRKRVTSLNKNWKLLIIDALKTKKIGRRRRAPLLRSGAGTTPYFLETIPRLIFFFFFPKASQTKGEKNRLYKIIYIHNLILV